jgi:hypothetical protein
VTGAFAATLRFAAFEGAVWAASARLARPFGPDRWLALLVFDITLESTVAGALSFAHLNSPAAYWLAAVALALYGRTPDWKWPRWTVAAIAAAALAAPLVLLAFRPVDEIDSVNYLHYLIEWMANRATPYSFATGYVAFWELSFLPAWTVTGVDLFFPILALKAMAVLAAALWLAGRELEVPTTLLAWTVFGALTMRHYWLEYSGVATLKNDALHGAGFVILLLVVVRAARGRLASRDYLLFAFGLAFAAVKYSGIFTGAVAAAILAWLARDRRLLWALPVFLLTSGHYYLRTLVQFGNPFYPFDLRLGPLHLRGEADLSFTSIAAHARDARVWRLLFAPAGGVSPAGLLFPAILAAMLLGGVFFAVRRRSPMSWAALLIVAGWAVYFRSVYSAAAGPGDVAFLSNGLNSIRYVDGVLGASELWLAALLGRWALPLVAVNTGSRLALLYARVPFPAWVAVSVALATAAVLWLGRRWAPAVVAAALLLGGPIVVERNRVRWTTYWNDLRPALDSVRGPDLAAFAMDEGSYYAGHVAAAGNPVDLRVRALLPEEIDALPSGSRPRYLAVLVTPGFDWHPHYADRLAAWGYRTYAAGAHGALFIANPR